MNTVSVTFTQEELNNLHALLDLAVKSSGLQGARHALAIVGKIESAIQQQQSNVAVDDHRGSVE